MIPLAGVSYNYMFIYHYILKLGQLCKDPGGG